jgi:hypothetical protein
MNGEPDECALQELYRALEMLPPEYRDAIVLHHLQGMTIEEVAGVLAANSGTIASRLSRGRAMIRERLSKREVLWSAAIVSWTLSAEWTTDACALPFVLAPDPASVCAFKASVIYQFALPTVRVISGPAAAAAVASTSTWSGAKMSVAASILALGATTTYAVPQVHDYFWPRRQTIKMTASASASAESVDAAKLPAEKREPAHITSVPEPTILPVLGFGFLALRRRRAR